MRRRTFLQGFAALLGIPLLKPREQAPPAGLIYTDSEGHTTAQLAILGDGLLISGITYNA